MKAAYKLFVLNNLHSLVQVFPCAAAVRGCCFHINLLTHLPPPKAAAVPGENGMGEASSESSCSGCCCRSVVAAFIIIAMVEDVHLAVAELFPSKQNLICITETLLCWALNIIQDTDDGSRIGHSEKPEWGRRSSFASKGALILLIAQRALRFAIFCKQYSNPV